MYNWLNILRICCKYQATHNVYTYRHTLALHDPIPISRRASTSSPVSSISMACLLLTLRDSATIGVEQNRPMLTPGVAKRAVSAATARSQLATSWQPAAEATPCTRAITDRKSTRLNSSH